MILIIQVSHVTHFSDEGEPEGPCLVACDGDDLVGAEGECLVAEVAVTHLLEDGTALGA